MVDHKQNIPASAICVMVLAVSLTAGTLDEQLRRGTDTDSLVHVWVFFKDKPQQWGEAGTRKALARRRRVSFPAATAADAPVSFSYIRDVASRGARLRNVFKWANAASFAMTTRSARSVAALPFVAHVRPVASHVSRRPARALRKSMVTGRGEFGLSYHQMAMIGVPKSQAYIERTHGTAPGTGLLIGVFDTGFRLKHRCFEHLVSSGRVIAQRDFVDNDSTVADPDSVASNADHPYHMNDGHGTQVLSLIAGREEGVYRGAAWGAQFLLARTEDAGEFEEGTIEVHAEEDNWAAAIVWAESLGVDIVSSSVAYRDGFTDWKGAASPDSDYTYTDMDGNSTIIALAAKGAAMRGVLVVNAVGNEENTALGTLVSPADVDGVIAVGGLNADYSLSYFSSTGPTSDGRIKPDLVAQGSSVAVCNAGPDFGYSVMNGTSFSTPMIAGLAALVWQCHPNDSMAGIRERVYSSCTLLPQQDSIDNYYGRGLPDGLLACLDSFEAYIVAVDSRGVPIYNAQVLSNNTVLSTTDSLGTAVVALKPSSLPVTLDILHPYFKRRAVTVDSVPSRNAAVMDSGNVLYVRLVNELDSTIANGFVFARTQGENAFTSYETDPEGRVAIALGGSSYDMYATAPGYETFPDTTYTDLDTTTEITITLNARPVWQFAVYPNVVRVSEVQRGVTVRIDFLATDVTPPQQDQLCRIAIRRADGHLVWEFSKYLTPMAPVSDADGNPLFWNCRTSTGRIVAPGMYFIAVRYAGKTYRKKILVSG